MAIKLKTTVICEIGTNWWGLEDIFASCEWAVDNGCTPKLQLWNTEKTVNKKRNPKMYETMKKYELKHDWVEKINRRFPQTIYSVFDLESLKFLESKIKPSAYKVASPDCVFKPLLQAVSKTGKPSYVSIGGATLGEIRECAKEFHWDKLILMECNASYPAKCAYLGNLRDRVNGSRIIPWGYSNHTTCLTVPALAVTLGAVAIEQHFKLDQFASPDNPHSLNKASFLEMLKRIEDAEHHLQTLEHPFPEEVETMRVARRKGDGRR